jgi:serine/threonine protein phosphatase PrpC
MKPDNSKWTGSSHTWGVLHSTVRGASHKRKGMPNQDACGFSLESFSETVGVIVAIADGHGGEKYVRSDRGAKFAIKAAIEQGRRFISQDLYGESRGIERNIHALAQEYLTKHVVKQWASEVRHDYDQNPLTEEETQHLKIENKNDLLKNPRLAYGTTLLMTILTSDFILHLQLGDGDILVISDEGEVSRPIAKDKRLFANDTTSLCADDAWKEFRIKYDPLQTLPALILLTTDGYANSHETVEGFERIGVDYLQNLRDKNGISQVEKNLSTWLEETSEEGSGDDITIGIIYRASALQKPDVAESDDSKIVEPLQSEEVEIAAEPAAAIPIQQEIEKEESQNADIPVSESANETPADTSDLSDEKVLFEELRKAAAQGLKWDSEKPDTVEGAPLIQPDSESASAGESDDPIKIDSGDIQKGAPLSSIDDASEGSTLTADKQDGGVLDKELPGSHEKEKVEGVAEEAQDESAGKKKAALSQVEDVKLEQSEKSVNRLSRFLHNVKKVINYALGGKNESDS